MTLSPSDVKTRREIVREWNHPKTIYELVKVVEYSEESYVSASLVADELERIYKECIKLHSPVHYDMLKLIDILRTPERDNSFSKCQHSEVYPCPHCKETVQDILRPAREEVRK